MRSDAVVQPILDGRADFVSGSRRLGSELTTDATRHAGVIVFGALISLLVRQRITDPACGLRAMRSEVTADVVLEQPQYQASELMISAALHGYRLAEVPTTMRDRGKHATGTKKGGNFGYGVRFARAAVHTWWRDRTAARSRDWPEKTHVLVDHELQHEEHRLHEHVGARHEDDANAVAGGRCS